MGTLTDYSAQSSSLIPEEYITKVKLNKVTNILHLCFRCHHVCPIERNGQGLPVIDL